MRQAIERQRHERLQDFSYGTELSPGNSHESLWACRTTRDMNNEYASFVSNRVLFESRLYIYVTSRPSKADETLHLGDKFYILLARDTARIRISIVSEVTAELRNIAADPSGAGIPLEIHFRPDEPSERVARTRGEGGWRRGGRGKERGG